MNISWYRKPLDGDAGGRPRARTLTTTISQTKPVKTRARNGNAIRRGSRSRTRRLAHDRWNPRASWGRRPGFWADAGGVFRADSVDGIPRTQRAELPQD